MNDKAMSTAKQWTDEMEFLLSDEMFPKGSTMQMNPNVIRDGISVVRQLEAEKKVLREGIIRALRIPIGAVLDQHTRFALTDALKEGG